MKITVVFVFAVIAFSCSSLLAHETCKFRKNYIAYNVTGKETVNGLMAVDIDNTIARAFKIYENTILGLHFTSGGYGIYMEELELNIKFTNLSPKTISRTVLNCTSNMAPKYDDVIFTIHNATILFNSNVQWKKNENVTLPGVHFFPKLVYEIGHVFGLEDNLNPSSVMYAESDNFNVLSENDELPEVDREAIGQKYFLKSLKKYV